LTGRALKDAAATAVRQKRGLPAMPKENDLEGVQDQGGKHGGQKGMPKPEPKPPHGPDQGIVRDEQGQEQPKDKARAQQVIARIRSDDKIMRPTPAKGRGRRA
jgi:hypothetical protein